MSANASTFSTWAITVAVAIALVGSAAGSVSASRGFTAASGKIRCAVDIPHRSGLFCAATGVRLRQYDGRGVLQLLADGRVVRPAAGSDLLLAIDGDRDGGRRPLLEPGQRWDADGFRCANTRNTVRCARDRHGFLVSATRYAIF